MVYYFIILFFIATNFQGALGGEAVKYIALAVLLLGVATHLFFKKGNLYFKPPRINTGILVFVAFMTVFTLSLYNTGLPGSTFVGSTNEVLTVLMMLVLVMAGISYRYEAEPDKELISSEAILGILVACGIVVTGMLVMFFVNYNKTSGGEPATILGGLGITMQKRSIIIGESATHPNTVGIYSSAVFVMSWIALKVFQVGKGMKWALRIFTFTAFGFILVADSRGSFGNAFIALLVVWSVDKLRFRFVPGLMVLLTPFLPFLLLATLSFVASTSVASKVSRSDDGSELADANSRGTIWDYCYEELIEFKPVHLMGYGAYGHYKAGLSPKYEVEIRGLEAGNPPLMVAHSFFFQSFLDVGYIGTILFVFSLFLATQNAVFLLDRGFKPAKLLIGYFVYYVLSGATESTFGLYNKTYFLITLMLIMVSMVVRSHLENTPVPNRSASRKRPVQPQPSVE
jgi:hypothetical protein